MAKTGILAPDARVQLLAGKIIDMSPIGRFHATCVNRLAQFFIRNIDSEQLWVSIQNPIRLGQHNEPEPDLAILQKDEFDYLGSAPTAKDVHLLIEVSDATLKMDQTVKVPLYASYGVPEVWVVDLKEKVVHTYADPQNGHYERQASFGAGEQISTALPVHILVDDVLIIGFEEE